MMDPQFSVVADLRVSEVVCAMAYALMNSVLSRVVNAW